MPADFGDGGGRDHPFIPYAKFSKTVTFTHKYKYILVRIVR